ncbi:ABC transporter substrate-binding protein [Paenibacillus thalictri]|uniref:Sugar ABC transporter substrate-binding protein n=1 Tax=Paenibacillus thalictri TaxID=2527873 RepID=A0A4V6MSF9_9BACL|nr:sugar ABC transporter substrate-binding protein [Paenibacillus thalictri]TBL76515.1 sugar ABC transporter substrate-binding protein [Paenibacillus thalictri]
MKKWVTTTLAVTVITSLAAGCSTAGKTDEKAKTADKPKQTVTFWMKKQLFDDQNKVIQERAKQFGVENNVNVNIELIAYEDFYPKWTAAIESGAVPDVSFFGYQEVGQFYAKNVLEDVSDLVQKLEGANGEIQPSLKKAISFQGKQYAIPFWTETQVLYYRKDLLKQAGFNEPPKTWDEFRKMAKALTDPSKGIYGAGIGYGKGNSDAEFFTRSVIWSYGGSLDTKDGKTVSVNTPETVEATKFIRDIFLTDKSTPPSAVGWDDSGNNKAYLSGQAAMILNVGSIIATLKKDNPDLYANTGLAPYPVGPKGSFIPGISNNLGIFKNSKNKDLAKKLVEYILTPDWYKTWIEKGAPLTGPIYTKLTTEPIWQDPMNKAFVDSVKGFTFLGYPSEYNPKAGEIFNLRIVNDAFQRLLLDANYSPEMAVKDLHSKIQDVYNQKN